MGPVAFGKGGAWGASAPGSAAWMGVVSLYTTCNSHAATGGKQDQQAPFCNQAPHHHEICPHTQLELHSTHSTNATVPNIPAGPEPLTQPTHAHPSGSPLPAPAAACAALLLQGRCSACCAEHSRPSWSAAAAAPTPAHKRTDHTTGWNLSAQLMRLSQLQRLLIR